MTKRCKTCGQVKALSEFYKRDGKARSSCKACMKKERTENYLANKEHFNAYRRSYQKAEPRRHRKYYETKLARFPEEMRARQLCRNARRRGDLIKESCVKCGNPETQAHHDDYSKPLDVIWLCQKHHRERDNQRANK